MFGFFCKNCGHCEISHDPDIDHYISTGLWPDQEYAEDSENEEFLRIHMRGYRFSLSKCPGFEYRKGIGLAVLRACYEHNPVLVEYLPKVLQVRSLKLFPMWDEKLEEKSESYMMPVHTHVLLDVRTGQSFVVMGE